MKKKNAFIFVILTLSIGTALIGCKSLPTQGYANSIEEAHPDRFEKTVIGMDIDEFKSIWPEANRIGLSDDGEIYEFIYTRLSGYMNTYLYKIHTHFHFTNNKLVKYESNQRQF